MERTVDQARAPLGAPVPGGDVQGISDHGTDTLRECDDFTFAPEFEIDQIVS
jgi:hypothetical protein